LNAASAGARGADVRSDAWIQVEPLEAGGVDVTLRSKVDALYGRSIREQIARGCAALGVKHAKVTVEDQGACPFVLDARLEAAVRKLGVDPGDALLPEMLPANREPSLRERARRSRVYLPGSTPKFLLNAALHQPDGVILDLEDSVAPSEKLDARILVRNALRFLDWGDCERMVRINQRESGVDDLPFVVGHGAQLVLIPKVERPEEVIAVAEAAAELAPDDPPWLIPILESARGVLAAEAIASSHPTVVALTIGLEDYTADLGAERTAGGRESFWARSQVVAAARSAGVTPIDSVYSDVDDLEGLREAVREARSLGFEGKGCIHPRQIRVVHESFAASAGELDRAKRIVLAYDDALARGLGVVSLGSKMIDAPVVKRAQRLVETEVRLGRLAADWREHA